MADFRPMLHNGSIILIEQEYHKKCYHRPRMREGNVFILSVCLSVWAITFECFDIETSFMVWYNILTISKSNLSTKVIE